MMPVTMRQGPIVFAHRGGSEEAPENTMSAFAHAYEAGVRHMETDAHLTAAAALSPGDPFVSVLRRIVAAGCVAGWATDPATATMKGVGGSATPRKAPVRCARSREVAM